MSKQKSENIHDFEFQCNYWSKGNDGQITRHIYRKYCNVSFKVFKLFSILSKDMQNQIFQPKLKIQVFKFSEYTLGQCK